ncbi:hypothetical protein ACFXTN_006650 [Malus domestica]
MEKNYSTFNVINIVLRQQYRAHKFTKFLDLIYVLLLAEKQNQLLIKNHQARPSGSHAMPKVHAIVSSSHNRRSPVVVVGKGDKPHHGPKVHQTEAHPREET